MRLSNLITLADGASILGEDRTISGVTADSREVKAGYLFVAIPGTKLNGQHFIPDAIARGAVAVLVDSETPTSIVSSDITLISAPSVRHALAIIASRFYPRQPQTIAAVTGTSGKTSTVQFARQFWDQAGHKAASLGTLGLITSDNSTYGSLTTPDPVSLHRTIDQVASDGITHLAMEASSQGIHMRRLDGVRVSIAAFTNISRDHLDYHETMERYFSAKLRLFTSILKQGGVAVLNADIPEYEDLRAINEARGQRVLSFGRKGHDLRLLAHSPDTNGQHIRFELMGRPYELLLPLIGEFQIWNSFCALCLAVGSGENPEKMAAALTKLVGVPGRLEPVGVTPTGGNVFVDYAHKPGALENVLSTLRPHVSAHEGAKLHVVFGCGGNRDKGKRPIMGEIASRLADRIIVTDDNPRGEEAATIRKEILTGCDAPDKLVEVGDRAKAIEQAIADLGKGDVLVIAGKGHEDGQIVGDTVLPFNDADVARKVLGQL